MPLKVCIVGSGNWGSAIAKIIGGNVTKFDDFENTVTLYVYEELVNGKKLSEIINETHENVKYLPGRQLPSNVVAEPSIEKAVSDADILVFVVPHQFIKPQLDQIKNAIKPSAVGLSLVKGFQMPEGGGIELISTLIKNILNIDVSVLMGANLANEVADEHFCETTIGSRHPVFAPLFSKLINTENFLVTVVDDVEGVEMCGALKNIVGCAAGLVDGLGLGDNTKSAVIRIGLVEMIKFCLLQSPQTKLSVFFQSCGIADLITTCYGGRNRRVCEAFVTSGGAKTLFELEKEMLNGQKLQGPDTAEEVCNILKNIQRENEFPFFKAINETLKGIIEPKEFIDRLRHNPTQLNW